MTSSLEEAVKACRKLSPSTSDYAKARFCPQKNKFEFPLVHREVSDEELESHVLGKSMIGGVAADDDGRTTCVGLDLDAHTEGQRPGYAATKFMVTAKALNIPVIVHSSKSGKGYHVRTLFSESVPTHYARAMYACLIILSQLSADTSVDKVWPPASGLGVLALPYNSRYSQTTGGCLALNTSTLKPLPKEEQLSTVLDSEEIALNDVTGQLEEFGCTTEEEARALSGSPLHGGLAQDLIKDGVDRGVMVMHEGCEACRYFIDHVAELDYRAWFGMMTNYKPFVDGKKIFEIVSQLDPARFNQKTLDKSWRAIRGKPVNCRNLFGSDWECAHSAECDARSPAGFPGMIVRRGKQTA